jgi:hypothetical protein
MIRSRERYLAAIGCSGRRAVVAMLAVVLPAIPGWAQTGGGYNLTWSSVDCGGQMFSTAGDYQLGSTFGQADASPPGGMSGGGYQLFSGFWGAAAAYACSCQLYGDVSPLGGDCAVDLADVLCVLDCFLGVPPCAAQANVAPCSADKTCNVDDILAVLDAFAGDYSCNHPCSPGSP